MKKTLDDWLSMAGNIHQKKIDLGLTRIRSVAQKMDLLTWHCPIFLVGGTNGKGSTSTTLETIYHCAGYKTACLTSPDLLRYNERIRVNRQEATDEAIVEGFEAVEIARGDVTLTFFEFNVLVALQIFKQAKPDVLILEIGLGGRLDAANILEPDLAIITSIDLDHMEFLGDTRDKIATEKAGIFRPNIPAVIGDTNPPDSLKQAVHTCPVDASFINADYHFSEQEETWTFHNNTNTLSQLPKPKVLLQNAATALQAIHCLQAKLPVSLSAIQTGLAAVFIPGRFQEICYREKQLIFDVAHNPASAAILSTLLTKRFGTQKLQAVFSILNSKDIKKTLMPLIPQIEQWHVAALTHERAMALSDIQQGFEQTGIQNVSYFDNIQHAFEHSLTQDTPIVVFGSFITVADILRQIL